MTDLFTSPTQAEMKVRFDDLVAQVEENRKYLICLQDSHIQLHKKIDAVVEAVEGALKGLQNNPMLRAFTGGK